MEKLEKGTQVSEAGDVISVKEKTDKRGNPFTGVTVKAMDGYLYWFRLNDATKHEDVKVGKHFPVEFSGFISGQTPDLELRFLEDVRLMDPALSFEERDQLHQQWFDIQDTVRAVNSEIRQEQKTEREAAGQVVLTGDLPVGTFTVQFNNGDYRTIRIKHPMEKAWNPDFEGWQFIGYLAGPANETDYKNFAYRKAGEQVVRLKNGYRDDSALVTCLQALVTSDPDKQHKMGVAWAKESGNCYVCNRKLTTPESMEAGIGPVCAGR